VADTITGRRIRELRHYDDLGCGFFPSTLSPALPTASLALSCDGRRGQTGRILIWRTAG
jgi:hypothetical protein